MSELPGARQPQTVSQSPPLLKKRNKLFIRAAVMVIAITLALVLYCFDPSLHGFYPKCVLFTVTGLQCPGCGGLRAAHALLHGNLREAFHLNPLLVIMIPLFIAFGIRGALRIGGQNEQNTLMDRPIFAWILFAVIMGFMIFRNL